MNSHLTPKISSFFVGNLRNSQLLRAISASNLNILDRNLLRLELIRGSLNVTILAQAAMKTRNRTYFEENIESCLDQLYGAALRMTRNTSDAEDLVAETVTRGLDKIDSLKDCSRFIHWLLRIMTNHFISECRKAEKRTRHESYTEVSSEDETPFSLFEQLHQPFLLWWGTPEQDFLNKTLNEDIARAMDTLADKYRVVVVLSDIEGMTYQEIADTIDCPIGTVRSRLARARSLLQKSLWKHGKERDLLDEEQGVNHEQ